MNINKQSKSLIKKLHRLITNPNSYVAAIVGTLAGLVTGSAIGLFSGGFIGFKYKICNGCVASYFDVNPDIAVGGIIGLVIGAITGGVITGIITILNVHKKTVSSQNLSPEHMTGVLFSTFWFSIEISIGMLLGAIIGSLKLPGIGSILGALLGTTLFVLYPCFKKN